MSPKYDVRLLKSGEEDKVLGLLKSIFKGWPHFNLPCSAREHWDWKYIDDPKGDGQVMLASLDDELMGCLHAYLREMKVGPRVFLCKQTADSGVLPTYQGFGVFTKLRVKFDSLEDEDLIGLHYGVSSNPAVHKTMKKVDPKRHRIPLTVLVKLNDFASMIKGFKLDRGIWLASSYFPARLAHIAGNLSRASTHIADSRLKIFEVSEFDERANDFWDALKESYNLIDVLDVDYLNWRYCDPRGGDYVIRQAEESERIIGFTVLRINLYGGDSPTGYVVGLYSLPERLDCAEALLDDALKYFEENRVGRVYFCVNKGHPYEEMFKRHGFVAGMGEVYLTTVAKNIGDEYEEYLGSPQEQILFQYGTFDWI